jgi:hypothetical protein
MSCLEDLRSRGYVYYPELFNTYLTPTQRGVIDFIKTNGKYIALLTYEPKGFKRIRVRYRIRVELTGGDLFTTYTCIAGFGVLRLVIYVHDVLQKLHETLLTLANTVIALELLRSLLDVIAV